MKILMRNQKNEKWQVVQSAAYGNEAELQKLIVEEPSLISIDEVRQGAGTLVAAVREFPLDVGSIDLVGFTAEGDIAVIECKLAGNPEVKRKVIGQVLEYGANLWEMDYETLDQKVTLRSGKSLADLVKESVVDASWDEEIFRQKIAAGLASGNFILIIVVDEINEELSRIIRFVNDAGRPAFSFAALEMQRFQNGQVEMLVPHVFGTVNKPKLPPGVKKKWDEDSFFAELGEKYSNSVDPARKILNWAKSHEDITRIWWGEGEKTGSFVPVVEYDGKSHQLFAVYTYGTLEVYFYWYQYKPQFASVEKRKELLDRLNRIEGVNIPDDAVSKRPNISLGVFSNPIALKKLLAAFDWFIQEIKSI